MVCAIDHLAASAGVAMLQAGGSAADAAVAAGAVLAITSQHQCGVGGDLFALVPGGEAYVIAADDPSAGAVVRQPGLARALQTIAERGRAGFYEGEFGEALLALGAGEYEPADLARSQADWVEPLAIDAWGHRLW